MVLRVMCHVTYHVGTEFLFGLFSLFICLLFIVSASLSLLKSDTEIVLSEDGTL